MEKQAPKIFSVTDGSGGYAEQFDYAEACDIAAEDTLRNCDILMVTVEIKSLHGPCPVAIAYHGQLYPLDGTDCPLCEGDGLIVTGWDMDSKENIEDHCPMCHATGTATGTEIAAYAIRPTCAPKEMR